MTLFKRYYVEVCLLLLMAFAALFSVEVLLPQSLRLDEAQSLWQTVRTPAGILAVIAKDVHVPLYHMMLHFWQQFVGSSVPSARILSLIFFLATIPMTYLLGRTAYGKGPSLFAAALVALSPFLNWYGSEIRMYSLLMFAVVANQYAFLRLQKEDTAGNWWLFFLTALAGIYSHYLFFAYLATQTIFLIMNRKSFPATTKWKFVTIYAALAFSFVPWVRYVVSLGYASNTRPLLVPPTTINLFNSLTQFIFGFQVDGVNTTIVSLWPLAILLFFLALQRNQRMSLQTKFFLTSFILPVVTVFVFSLVVRPFFVSRYLIFVVPSFYLALSWLFTTYGHPTRIMQVATLALVTAALVAQGVSAHTPVREDYKPAVDYISSQVTASDVIIVSSPFTIYPVEYYYNGPAKLETLPRWDRTTLGIPPYDKGQNRKDVADITRFSRKACVMLSYDQGHEKDIKDAFDNTFARISDKTFSPGLSVYCYQTRYGLDR